MLGGSPMMLPTYPAAPAVSRPAPPQPPRPLVRAKGPEEPKLLPPMPLTLPTPEQLGLTIPPSDTASGESTLQARMRALSVLRYHRDKVDGHCRFVCWVAGDRPGVTRCIEAVAATDDEAMRLALERVERSR